MFTLSSGFKVTFKGCDSAPSLTPEFAATEGVGMESDVLDAEGLHVRLRYTGL